MQQRSGYRGINTTRQAQQHLVAAHLVTNLPNRIVYNLGRGPQGLALADIQDEMLKNPLALERVRHLRMKLDTVQVPAKVLHGGNGRTLGGGQ